MRPMKPASPTRGRSSTTTSPRPAKRSRRASRTARRWTRSYRTSASNPPRPFERAERFALEGYTVTLDSVDGVGEYVEVETDVDGKTELEAAREGAYDVLERLGLDPDDQLRTSYLGLLLESEETGS